MTRHTALVTWDRGGAAFTDNHYSRAHRWTFDGGVEVPASSSPHVVRAPLSDPAAVDPEEAFVAALSSCHMLWFLSIAARRGYVVETYEDRPEGVMARNELGRMAITRVTLRPRIRYGDNRPSGDEEAEIHREAHEACYLANSVRTTVTVEAQATA